MIVIVGESASGKTSVAKYLEDKFGFKRIVTYTTRSPRTGEVDGVDYHFIDDKKYAELADEGFFAETATYNGWHYGSAKKDYVEKSIAVLTPKGLRSIRRNGIDAKSFYISVPRKDRLMMCLFRGDNIEEAYRRNLSDVGQFDGIEDEVDCVIYNSGYMLEISDVAETIIRNLNT